MGVDGGSKVIWTSPFPGMDEVGGKGDGIAIGTITLRVLVQHTSMDRSPVVSAE